MNDLSYLIYLILDTMQRIEAEPLKEDYSQEITKLVHNSRSFTTFHVKTIAFFMLVSFFTNLQINSSSLFYMNPAFFCQGIQGKQAEQYACQRIESCEIINRESVTAQLKLYCEGSTRIYIQSSMGIGNWIGIVFSAIISDRMGRKFCFIVGFVFLNISWIVQYIGINRRIIILLSISQIIIGLSNNIIYMNFLMLSSRFINKSLNQTVTLGWSIASNIGVISISILNSHFQDWRALFYIYSIAIATLSIFSFIVLYEDPVYYFDVGEYEKCKNVIRQIEMQNGRGQFEIEQKNKLVNKLLESKHTCQSNRERSGQVVSPFKFLSDSRILSYVIILGVVTICFQMSGICSQYSIQGLKLPYNENLFIMGASNIFGFVTAIFAIKMESNRKRGFFFSTFLCSIIGLTFGFKFCTQNSLIESICISCLKITGCWISCFFVRLKVDLAPEKYQGSLIGLIEFIGNFGRVIGPSFVQLSTRNSLNPIFSVSILNLTFGSLPLIFLSERKIKLDQRENIPIHE